MMADCQGRPTGKPGICFVTRGPGATNASAGVHIAMQDSVPMILFIGQVASHAKEREAFQEVDYVRFFGDIAKWVVEIDDASRIPEFVTRAFAVATSGRPGPVVMSLPEDMLTSEVEAPEALPYAPVETRPGEAELDALEKGLGNPKRPVVAIVGGAKVSTKIDLLQNLVKKVDALVIGGGMANTFLAAQGIDVGKSLCEHELADTARAILAAAKTAGCEIVLPTDAVVARKFEANAANETVPVGKVPADAMILDVGPATVKAVEAWIGKAATLVWNGPLGAFEIAPFDRGTVAAAKTAARLTKEGRLVSVVGGGDTVAALHQAGVADDFTYVSTAGGAFLEWMEGKELAGVEALRA